MVNSFNFTGLPAPIKADYQADPRLLMAQQLMQQGQTPIDPNRMAGRYVVPISPLEGLSKALTGAVGGWQSGQVHDEYKQKADEYRKGLAGALQGASSYGDAATKLQASDNPYLQDIAATLTSKQMDNDMSLKDKALENQMTLQREVSLATNPDVLKAKIQVAGASRPVTNVNTYQEKEFDKKVGGEFGQQYADLQKNALAAPGKISKMDRLNQLLDGVNTGAYKGTTTDLKAAAKSAGIDLEAMGIKDDVAPVQAAQALSQAMSLELRNPSGGAGMPGALSDSDRKFLTQMTPGIETTPQGRALMIDTQKKLTKREQDTAKLAADYRKKNGKFDEGFYNELAQYSAANPLFDAPASPAAPAAPAAPATNRPPLTQFFK